MQTTKLLLAFFCANAPISAADNDTTIQRQSFDHYFGTLGGSSIQPSAALQRTPLQPSRLQPTTLQGSSLQTSAPLQPAALEKVQPPNAKNAR